MTCRLTCDKGKLHMGESLELICLNDSCLLQLQPLNCIICIEEEHQGHELVHINKFMTLFKKQNTQLQEQIKQRDSHVNTDPEDDDDLIQKVDNMQNRLNQTLNTIKEKIGRAQKNTKTLKEDLPSFKTMQAFLNDDSMAQNLFRRILSKVQYNRVAQDLTLRRDFIFIDDEMFMKDRTTLYLESVAHLIENIEVQINLFYGDAKSPYQMNKSMISFKSLKQIGRMQSSDLGKSVFLMDRIREDTSIAASPTNQFRQSGSIAASPTNQFRQSGGFTSPTNNQFRQSAFNSTNRSIDEFTQSKSLSKFYSQSREKPQLIQDRQSITVSQQNQNQNQNQNISKYSFSIDYKGDGIQIDKFGMTAKLTQDLDRRMILIQPALHGGGGVTRESAIKLRVKTLKNLNQRYPMAVGICILSKMQKCSFIFNGVSENLSTSRKSQDHGCYLVNSNGIIRSCVQSDDLTKAQSRMRFFSGSDIQIIFKPFHSEVLIKRFNDKDKSQEVSSTLKIELHEGDKIYGCVRLADLSDQLEILP